MATAVQALLGRLPLPGLRCWCTVGCHATNQVSCLSVFCLLFALGFDSSYAGSLLEKDPHFLPPIDDRTTALVTALAGTAYVYFRALILSAV